MADHVLADSVKSKFETFSDLSCQPCIYKAPDHLRAVNEECYRPYVISIGPLHYGRPSLEAMQDCKLRCLNFFLEHDSNSNRSNLEHYLKIITEMEGRVRDCYAESISLPSDAFNVMVLVDAAFIICLFMKFHPISSVSSLDFLFHMSKRNLLKWEFKLKRDLFLEENQIPFFVLRRLFQETFGKASPDTSFLDLACKFIADGKIPVVHGLVNAETTIERIRNDPNLLHLVDLLRNFCFPSTLREQAHAPNTKFHFPTSLSNLKAAGVKFVPSKSANLLDITFSNGVLEIPPFELWDVSESYFRSIILFEQSHHPIINTSYFHHYMVLLEKLIRTPEDLQILFQCGIIDNWIGGDEIVARLFNGGITEHVPLPVNFCYVGVCQKLNAHANTRRNQWKAILKRDYFSHPWVALSVIYALSLFVLSLAQTIGTYKK